MMESDEDTICYERPRGRPRREDVTEKTKRRRINKDFTVRPTAEGSVKQDKTGSPSPSESGSDKEDPVFSARDCLGELPNYSEEDLRADLHDAYSQDKSEGSKCEDNCQNLSMGDSTHVKEREVSPPEPPQMDYSLFPQTQDDSSLDNDYGFDINDLGTLHYDCEVCIACLCVNCIECVHNEDGNCSHCFSCLCDLDSDVDVDDCAIDIAEVEISSGSEDEVVLSREETLNNAMRADLVDICLNNNLGHQAIDDILGFLQKYNVGQFPRRAKTLLKTSRKVLLRDVPPGQYWHNGITKHLLQYATSNPDVSVIDVTISTDGVPLFNSSNASFWPLTCSFNDNPEVHVIGLYFGDKKPADPNDYLSDFVKEVIPLCEEGLHVKSKIVSVVISKGIFDAVAKSWVLSVSGCNAKEGCFKCLVEGETEGHRTYFIDLSAAPRTDESFVNNLESTYHKGRTMLAKIPGFGCVTSVPLDYMHLVLLGTMRKLVYMWVGGPLAVRQGSAVINMISEELVRLVGWVPSDFARKTRSLHHVRRFKATEYRLLLLYVGVVVLSKNLPSRFYEHYLVLHVLMTILVDQEFCKTHLQYAKELSVYFVQTFKELYGKQFVSHNVHSMIHLPDDVEAFGPVDNFSAFKFENFYQQLKKMVRKGDKPLQQVAYRCMELETRNLVLNKKSPAVVTSTVIGRHNCGPLLAGCKNPQFSSFTLKDGRQLNLSEANRCCLVDDCTVVLADNFATNVDGDIVLIGREFLKLEDVYQFPCSSSMLGIFYAHQLSVRKVWPASRISRKCFRMPWKNGFAVMQM